MVSTLTRFFGVENLDLVENVVQETLLKALLHSLKGLNNEYRTMNFECRIPPR
jgi:hypothetical protein